MLSNHRKFCDAMHLLAGGTYPVQSSLWCNHRAIQLKKVLKNSEKNLECASQPTSSIYKISGSNSSSSRSYKKDKFRLHLNYYKKDKFRLHLNYYFCQKICLFVTSRRRRIWSWNFIYIWSRLRCTLKIFFRIFWNFFSWIARWLHHKLDCTGYVHIWNTVVEIRSCYIPVGAVWIFSPH